MLLLRKAVTPERVQNLRKLDDILGNGASHRGSLTAPKDRRNIPKLRIEGLKYGRGVPIQIVRNVRLSVAERNLNWGPLTGVEDNLPRERDGGNGSKFYRGKLYTKHRRKRRYDKVGLDDRFTRRRNRVEIIRVTGRELRLQPRTVVPDVEGELALDLVQGIEENIKEYHPVERAERVALGPPTSGDPGIVSDRHKRRIHALAHPVGGRQTLGRQRPEIGRVRRQGGGDADVTPAGPLGRAL
jgi:hypothetical protein